MNGTDRQNRDLSLNILFVEDSEIDLLVLLAHFRRAGYVPNYLRVDTPHDLHQALQQQPWDLIISDYCMPGFCGLDALQIVREKRIDAPFIIVSGNIGEETAVAAMKAGAHDYIFKGNLRRLIPVVERELREAGMRRESQLVQCNLQLAETQFRQLVEHIPAVTYIADIDNTHSTFYISPQIEEVLGYSLHEFQSDPEFLRRRIHPEDRERVLHELARCYSANSPLRTEYRLCAHDNRVLWFRDAADIVKDNTGKPCFLQGVMLDITEHKANELRIQTYQNQLRCLASEVSLAEERERRHLAIALHDQISQTLAFAKMQLFQLAKQHAADHAQLIKDIQLLVEQAYQYTKSLTFELSPPILYDLGFQAALEWLADYMMEQHTFTVHLDLPKTTQTINVELAMFLFRAVRELITNAIKHAKVTNAQVAVKYSADDLIYILVSDDGAGFNPELIDQNTKYTCFGLFSLRERLSYFGGEFDIQASPGKGTKVSLVVPMNAGYCPPRGVITDESDGIDRR
ncbi:MAG: sensor histidine kinase [Armatimonadota bacterium]